MEVDDQEKENQLQDERYDRTIRALTAEVALKLMKSRIALCPMNGVITEFMKNIILDGANVTIFDDTKVTEDDVGTNFMLSPNDIGKVKGEVLKQKFNEMNPYSQIEAKPLLNINEIYQQTVEGQSNLLKDYDILAVSTLSFQEMILWDKLATHLNKPLYILNCCGLYGFVWINLGKDFVYRRIKPKVEVLSATEQSESENTAQENAEYEEVSVTCKSLEECLNPNIKGKSIVYYSIVMMYEAERNNLRYDPYNPDESVLDKIVEIGKEFYTKNKFRWNDNVEPTLRNFARLYGVQYCPSYSVVGSVSSQEFTKVLARNAEPSYNWFCYDSQAGYGKMEYI